MTRQLGIYGLLRAVKSRTDRLRPQNVRHRRISQLFYRQLFGPGDLVFDIGANIGNRTEVFLDLGATVIAIEPQPPCQQVLKKLFGNNHRFTLVAEAVGAQAGEAQMFVSDALVLSTLSADWVSKMRESRRFGDLGWNSTAKVSVRTLDSLIAQYGVPAFCKIDVEGFELEVIRGLSQPLKGLSLEAACEHAERIVMALDCLDALGPYEYNYSVSESMNMTMHDWVDGRAIRRFLRNGLSHDNFGDVYARRLT